MLISLLLLIVGEGLAIYAEMLAGINKLWNGLLIGLISVPFLIFGYYYGSKFGIWYITAASISSIIVMEPILVYIFFKEFPDKYSIIACGLGVIGLLISLAKSK